LRRNRPADREHVRSIFREYADAVFEGLVKYFAPLTTRP
jgi:hypothetical protein